MATENDTTPSGWNTETLKQFFSTGSNDYKISLSQRLNAFETTIDHRLTALDLRFEQRYQAQEQQHSESMNASEKMILASMASAKEAVIKAEVASEKRFESVNEFRAALTDQTVRMMPRNEMETRMQAMADKITDLVSRIDRDEGKGVGAANLWAFIVGGLGMIGIIVTIVATIIRVSAPTTPAPVYFQPAPGAQPRQQP